MKKHNYKEGDKVRITGNDGNGLHHHFGAGDICVVERVFDERDVAEVVRVDDPLRQRVNFENIEPVETDKPAIFDRDDIKAGYLLEVKVPWEGAEPFYVTVLPSHHYDGADLGCCCPGKYWCPVDKFYDGRANEILRVYGPTSNQHLLDNTTEDRELLWERPEEPKAVEMTAAEISEKLGYEVKIVKKH